MHEATALVFEENGILLYEIKSTQKHNLKQR